MKSCPFPQANSIELMYSILLDIGTEGFSKYDIAKKYDIDERQGSYYLDALMFINLVEKVNRKYFLTQKGVDIRLTSSDDRKRVFCDAVLEHSFIGDVYDKVLSFDSASEKKDYIASRIVNEYELGNATSNRRASSIISWLEWIEIIKGEKND